MLKATRVWHCHHCGEEIKPGEKFRIVKGEFIKEGHGGDEQPKADC